MAEVRREKKQIPVTTYTEETKVILELSEEEAYLLYRLFGSIHGDAAVTTKMYTQLGSLGLKPHSNWYVQSRPGRAGGIGIWNEWHDYDNG